MSQKTIKIERNNAENHFINGFQYVKDLLKELYGPNSKSVVFFNKMLNNVEVISDGRKVASYLEKFIIEDVSDEENLAIKTMCKYILEMNEVGDGGTTFTIITATLLKEIYKSKISSKQEREKIIKLWKEKVLKILDVINSSEINDDIIEKIGAIASNNSLIGKCLREAFSVGKKNTTIIPRMSNKTEAIQQKGFVLKQGYGLSDLLRDEEKQLASVQIKNPFILASSCVIPLSEEFSSFLNELIKQDKYILLITPSDFKLTKEIASLRKSSNLKIFNIQLSSMGGVGLNEIVEDIISVVGGKDCCDCLNTMNLNFLGKADLVIVNKLETCFLGGKGNPEILESRIKTLTGLLSNTNKKEVYMLEDTKNRLSNLSSSLFYLNVESKNEMDFHEKLQTIRDAISSCTASFSGIIPGGGVEFLLINYLLQQDNDNDICMSTLKEISQKVFEEPFRILCENSGESFTQLSKNIIENFNKKNTDISYNFITKETGQMLKVGVINSTEICKYIIKTSAEVCLLVSGINSFIIQQQRN